MLKRRVVAVMERIIFIIFLTILKESCPLNPEILKFDQYMKDFEITGRRMKQEAKEKMMDGSFTKRENNEEPFIFPEIKDGNALEPTLNLLLSQQKHYEKVYKLYEQLWDNNLNLDDRDPLRKLAYEFGDSIFMVRDILNQSITDVNEYIKNGTVEKAIKREPLDDMTTGSLLDQWRFLKEYAVSQIPKYGFNVTDEVDMLIKTFEIAHDEMKTYDKYLGIMYEEEDKDRIGRPKITGYL